MDYRQRFSEVHQRPQMYGVDGSYSAFCAYLHGVNDGNDGQLFVGFTESLVVRVGEGTNLDWSSLVLRLAFPNISSGWRNLLADPERNRAAVDTLFVCLEEFLDRRSRHGELAKIFDEYLSWLKNQDWYRPQPDQN